MCHRTNKRFLTWFSTRSTHFVKIFVHSKAFEWFTRSAHRAISIQLLSVYKFYLQNRKITGIEVNGKRWMNALLCCTQLWVNSKHSIRMHTNTEQMRMAPLFYNSYIGSIEMRCDEMSEWNKCDGYESRCSKQCETFFQDTQRERAS